MRRLTGIDKAGHSGTLDPGVTGMLPIGLGQGHQGARPAAHLPQGVRGHHADTLLRPAGGGRPSHRGVHGRDFPAPAAALLGQAGDPNEADLRARGPRAEGEPLPPQVRLPGGHLHQEALLRHRGGHRGRRDHGRASQDEGGPPRREQGDRHAPRARHRRPKVEGDGGRVGAAQGRLADRVLPRWHTEGRREGLRGRRGLPRRDARHPRGDLPLQGDQPRARRSSSSRPRGSSSGSRRRR